MSFFTPFKPRSTLACFLLLLSSVFLIVSLSIPDFLRLTVDISPIVIFEEHLGAFRGCAGVTGLRDVCSNIDSDCQVSLDGRTAAMPSCSLFNAFRAFLLFSTIFTSMSAIAAVLVLYTDRLGVPGLAKTLSLAILCAGLLTGLAMILIGFWRQEAEKALPITGLPETSGWAASFGLSVTAGVLTVLAAFLFTTGASIEGGLVPNTAQHIQGPGTAYAAMS